MYQIKQLMQRAMAEKRM